MAARKQTKKQTKKQYVRSKVRNRKPPLIMLRRMWAVTLVLLVFSGVIYGVMQGLGWVEFQLFSGNPRFEIQYLNVSSDGTMTEDRIREYSGLVEGTNLFKLKFNEIEARLQKVPLVESVVIVRHLPNTLEVKVKERTPIARIINPENLQYPFGVDQAGYVLPYRLSAQILPLITGVVEEVRAGEKMQHPDVEKALDTLKICNRSQYLRNYVHTESLDFRLSDYIDMRLTGGIRVRLPRYSLTPNLQRLTTVLKMEAGAGKRVREVDLTGEKVVVTYY